MLPAMRCHHAIRERRRRPLNPSAFYATIPPDVYGVVMVYTLMPMLMSLIIAERNRSSAPR